MKKRILKRVKKKDGDFLHKSFDSVTRNHASVIVPRNARHIAVFSLAYFPFVGGAEIAIKEITDRLRGDYKFTCITHKFDKSWPNSENFGNVSVLRLGRGGAGESSYYGSPFKKIKYAFSAWRAAERLHKREPLTAIWAMMASYAGIAALFFKLRHSSVPMLLTLQEGDSEAYILKKVSIFYPLWKMIFKKADHIQVISNYLADFARRHGARCEIEVVPNGVQNQENKKIKKQENRRNGEKIIITTSRLVNKNGVDLLIKAFPEVIKKIRNCKVKILGMGPEEAKLKKLAKDLGVSNKIDFLGHVFSDEVPAHLSSAHLFVRPSRSEGLGNSFLEAMAVGLPVIGTKVGGIPDFLKDPNHVGVSEATGVFAKANNYKDLAQKIIFVLSNDEVRSAMVRNARKLVLKNYSWEDIAKRMGEIFAKII